MISLREFAYEIRLRINEGRNAEAIPLAQYLLRRHPRYLRGYQLLAEAALEEGNLPDAIEIFSRVMSADPESFAAHAGLASAYTDRNELDNALWHMTRAYELEPGMKAVRDQLRFLHEVRDGRAPGRLRLTPAALARNYLRSGAYDIAIEELLRELEQEPDRIDLRVALAEAYWFANQPQEAARTAYDVLDELPLAFKPHLILATFYYQAGEMEKAETHLRIAQELDPENDIAISIFGESAPFRAIAIPIDEPENIEKGTAPLGGASQLPEWLRDLSLFAESEAPTDGMDWEAVIAHEDDWRTRLADATRTEIAAYKPNWRAGLRLATLRALRERGEAEEGESPTEAATVEAVTGGAAPVHTGAITETISLLPPEWAATLRFATEEALAERATGREGAHVEPAHDPTIDLPTLTPAADFPWVPELRDATEHFIDEIAAVAVAPDPVFEREEEAALPDVEPTPAARPRITARWIPTLRVATEIWVAMQRRGSAVRRTAVAEESEPAPAAPEPFDNALSGGGDTPREAYADVVQVEGDAPAAAPAETYEKIPEPLPDDVTAVDADESSDTTYEDEATYAPAAETVTGDAEARDAATVARTPLEEARNAWQRGDFKEAVGRYQILFYEEQVPDDELSGALAEWVNADSAPALLYQLLGDVYRRMGRMQDAVAHYREAINRM